MQPTLEQFIGLMPSKFFLAPIHYPTRRLARRKQLPHFVARYSTQRMEEPNNDCS